MEERVVHVVGLKPPPERLTITPKVINSAESIFLFAMGKKKVNILFKFFSNPDNTNVPSSTFDR